MRILQRNLKRTTDTFLFISHTTNVLLFKFRCNIFIGVRIVKKMPGSVASGTLCINGMAKFPPLILDICASRKCGQFNVPAILVSEKLMLSQFGRPINQSGCGGKEKNSSTWMTPNPGHPVRKQSCYCCILSFG